MKYYIDTEFDSQHGDNPLLSMALVSETGKSLYVVMDYATGGVIHDQWVRENVIPHLFNIPHERINTICIGATKSKLSSLLESYFKGDEYPYVVSDWPVDLGYLTDALITGPGTMIDVPRMKMSVARVDAYPTLLLGAIQHNAWWDAMALRKFLTDKAQMEFDLEGEQ